MWKSIKVLNEESGGDNPHQDAVIKSKRINTGCLIFPQYHERILLHIFFT